MLHDDDTLSDLMHSITLKSARLTSRIQEKPEQLSPVIKELIHLTEQFQHVITTLLKNPEHLLTSHMAYYHKAMMLTQSFFDSWQEGKPLPINDPRFNTEHWLTNPFFNGLSQHYILATEHVNTLLENIEYRDKQSAKRLQFFIKQYLNAISPANFIQTNPEVLAAILESSGKNVLQGLHNLLSDLEGGPSTSRITMTDATAYSVGKNLATTPGVVIFRNDMMELIQYTPQTQTVKSIPLLVIPPWINKYYILDLSPNNSLIRWLVAHHITVFVISWVNPNAEFAKKELYDYLQDGPKTALEIIKKQMHVTQVNTVGFCIGGTLLALLLAYNKHHQDTSIRSATFLASMIDFSDPGDIGVFIDEEQIAQLETQMAEKGYLSGRIMARSFNSLKANELVWSFFIKNYLQGNNPVPFDILFWNDDTTNMPATMHSQYLRWMYLQNDLIKPHAICLNNTPIDVTTIDTPVFFLSTEKDHIAPWKTTYRGFGLMKGPKRFVLGGSGHIAGIINAPDASKYSYKTNNRAPANPEKWVAHAKSHEGSWWPEWLKWLQRHSGNMIVTSKLPPPAYAPIMDAPGSYVLNREDVDS